MPENGRRRTAGGPALLPELQSLPVVVITGLPDSQQVDRARHLKVNTVMVKGKATPEEIAEAVRLELHRVPA